MRTWKSSCEENYRDYKTMKTLGTALAGVLMMMMMMAVPSVFGLCQPAHPQTQFCNAELVIIGTVEGKQLLAGPPHPSILPGQLSTIRYKLRVDDVKKGDEFRGQLWNDTELFVNTTAHNSYGVPWLELGRQYVLTVRVTNRNGFLDFCYFNIAYSELTNMQRRGINGAYNRGCSPQCQIYICGANCPPTPPNDQTCMHGNSQTHQDCYYHHGYCRARTSGKCLWKTDGAYSVCVQGT